MPTPPADGKVTTDQAATILGVPASTIRSWKNRRQVFPCGYLSEHGRDAPLYRLSDLQALAGRPRGRPPTRRSEPNNLIAEPE